MATPRQHPRERPADAHAAELRAVDVSSSHQFDEEIGAASSENGLFIAKMEFSAWSARLSGRMSSINLCNITMPSKMDCRRALRRAVWSQRPPAVPAFDRTTTANPKGD